MKKLRYTVENFLPAAHDAIGIGFREHVTDLTVDHARRYGSVRLTSEALGVSGVGEQGLAAAGAGYQVAAQG